MKEIGEEVLIVKMYVGEFNNENIGHEIINFLKQIIMKNIFMYLLMEE